MSFSLNSYSAHFVYIEKLDRLKVICVRYNDLHVSGFCISKK